MSLDVTSCILYCSPEEGTVRFFRSIFSYQYTKAHGVASRNTTIPMLNTVTTPYCSSVTQFAVKIKGLP